MEDRNPKKTPGSKGQQGTKSQGKSEGTSQGKSQGNSHRDKAVWKGLFKKLGKDRALRKALSDLGILEEEDGEMGAAETLHRILDAIKAGSLSSSIWRAAPDDESCSSSEDEDEEEREFANVGDPTQQYEYNARSVTKTVQVTPVDDEAVGFDPVHPLAWSERNGMGKILVTPLHEFFEEYFETKPLHERVAGGNGTEERFSSLLTEDAIFSLMAEKSLRYGQDVDVTIVGKDDVRQTLNGDGFVDAARVKSRFLADGCSVRLLHPQRFSDPLWSLMYKLECFWGSCVGCNAYLTPKGSHQGFSQHFDDVDVFVLQVSGKKKWRLYRSPEDSLVLPRYSSRDFARGELGKPFWKGTLHAGDVLYLPRGMIHDAVSVADTNSLHVTISVNQRNNYFEFLTSLFSDALESCARDQVAFRRTLPVRYLLPDDVAKEQLIFDKQIDRLMESAFLRVDRQGTICRAFSDFMLNRLPPPPDTRRFIPCLPPRSLESGMSVALTFPQSAYAELDISGKEPALFVYHCLSNSRDLHQTLDEGGKGVGGDTEPERVEPQLEVPLDCGPALHTLLSGEVLPLGDKDMAGDSLRVIDLAQALLDAGILSVVAEDGHTMSELPPRKRRR